MPTSGIPQHFAVLVDVRCHAQVLSPRRTAMSLKLVHHAVWTSTHATQCKPACSPNQCVNYPTSRAIAALASDYPAQYVAPDYISFRGRVRWEVRLQHENKGNGRNTQYYLSPLALRQSPARSAIHTQLLQRRFGHVSRHTLIHARAHYINTTELPHTIFIV